MPVTYFFRLDIFFNFYLLFLKYAFGLRCVWRDIFECYVPLLFSNLIYLWVVFSGLVFGIVFFLVASEWPLTRHSWSSIVLNLSCWHYLCGLLVMPRKATYLQRSLYSVVKFECSKALNGSPLSLFEFISTLATRPRFVSDYNVRASQFRAHNDGNTYIYLYLL